jgi:mono/diheme cytochrome c family protein
LKPLAYAILCWNVLWSFGAAAESFDRVKFFESQIRPIFENNCVECHGEKKQKGGLSLHLKKTAFAGGDSGSSIVVGDAENSLMIKAVERRDKDFAMPPKKVLPADKVALLRKWIDAGAAWPEDRSVTRKIPPAKNIAGSRGEHWAFRPIARSEKGNKSIDKILEIQLEKQSMNFSSRADARILIRRAYFDLIGLPPSYEQVQQFEKLIDQSPKKFGVLIDQLLDQPEYGEHWGRHWLDVARYADTKGAVPIFVPRRYPFSYTYRDYVIRAFNEDLPYDQFIREQLAVDLLPGVKANSEKLAALGYITVGRRSRVNDDVIDERIDAVTRGLMGMTVSCARCHDHKSDPISI